MEEVAKLAELMTGTSFSDEKHGAICNAEKLRQTVVGKMKSKISYL